MSKDNKISQQGDVNPVPVPSESTQMRVLSTDDSLVADLVREQPTESQVTLMKVRERKAINLLELPEECLPLQGKKYRFVWLTKDKDLSVKLRTNGWILCNRMNASFIKPYRFGSHGAVEQAGMLLAFLPEAVAVENDMVPVRISQSRVKHYTEDIFKNQDPDAGIQYYKPEDKGEE
jgi:hypothetical protein